MYTIACMNTYPPTHTHTQKQAHAHTHTTNTSITSDRLVEKMMMT